MQIMNAVMLLLPILAGQMAGPSPGPDSFILTEREAVGMMPPKVVCEYAVTNVSWSPTGSHLVVVRTDPGMTAAALKNLVASPKQEPPEPQTTLMLVDAVKGTSQAVYSVKGHHFRIDSLAWLPNTNNLLFTTRNIAVSADSQKEMHRLYWMNAVAGKPQLLLEGNPDEAIKVFISPTLPRGIVLLNRMDWETGTSTHRLTELRNDGRLGRTVNIPNGLASAAIAWTSDGATPIFDLERFGISSHQRTSQSNTLTVDFASGKVEQIANVAFYKPTPTNPTLYVDVVPTEVKTGDKTDQVPTSWLKSRVPSKRAASRIGADTLAILSPTENALFTMHKGVGMLVPLAKVPRDAFEQALAAAERASIMSDAKQCALGLMILAADYDENLPSNNEDWMSKLNPYVKNQKLLDGFVYTFGGGSLSDLKDPAKTELGYKEGPGGRAVAYADGHVVWVPNK